jgi:hypothetical protein
VVALTNRRSTRSFVHPTYIVPYRTEKYHYAWVQCVCVIEFFAMFLVLCVWM